ncbi:hypothetical protein HPP92_011914 [Vanilla planifolia]|uniref:Uncharacterized protein n=1 Tax=Vanilla planifolia TaxID=51239 RepID=A0A835QWL0_VANPL|nr:hypothetical protein HPP92_011914 [Vanilla planifolia]
MGRAVLLEASAAGERDLGESAPVRSETMSCRLGGVHMHRRDADATLQHTPRATIRYVYRIGNSLEANNSGGRGCHAGKMRDDGDEEEEEGKGRSS